MSTLLRSLTVAGLALTVSPAVCAASGWTQRAILEPGCGTPAYNCSIEPAPRAAVNARGQTAIAWIAPKSRVRVASAGANGRFGRAATLGRGLGPAVAIAADGTQVAVWSSRGVLRFARRTPGHRFTRSAQLVARGARRGDLPKLAAQPDGGTLVVYESSARLRSVMISASGKVGAVRTLGLGAMQHDSFRASPDGAAALCCLRSGPVANPASPLAPRATTVARYVPGAGWSMATPALGPRLDVETVATGGGAVALGAIDVHRSGDAGPFGLPALLPLSADNTFATPLLAPVASASRAFGPVVAIDGGGRGVLVYQEKDQPSAFTRTAPVYAVATTADGAFGPRQLLDAKRAYLPLVRRYRDGAIIAWETTGHRWRVSLERDGRFAAAAAPASSGPTTVGQDFLYSRDLATGGRYAVLTWTAIDGSIRASIGVV